MKNLVILWTTDNKATVQRMIIKYAINAKLKSWWDKVTVIIWGASAKLVGDDEEIQLEVLNMIKDGVVVESCLDCTDHFGVSELFLEMGIDVKYMGAPFTEYLQSDAKVITI